jgi:hypothetical protein
MHMQDRLQPLLDDRMGVWQAVRVQLQMLQQRWFGAGAAVKATR